jgi:hypothetical protein
MFAIRATITLFWRLEDTMFMTSEPTKYISCPPLASTYERTNGTEELDLPFLVDCSNSFIPRCRHLLGSIKGRMNAIPDIIHRNEAIVHLSQLDLETLALQFRNKCAILLVNNDHFIVIVSVR